MCLVIVYLPSRVQLLRNAGLKCHQNANCIIGLEMHKSQCICKMFSVYDCSKSVCLGLLPLHWSGYLHSSALLPGHCSAHAGQGDILLLLVHLWHTDDSCYGPQQVVSLRHCWSVWGHHHWALGCVQAWLCLLVIHPVGVENLP